MLNMEFDSGLRQDFLYLHKCESWYFWLAYMSLITNETLRVPDRQLKQEIVYHTSAHTGYTVHKMKGCRWDSTCKANSTTFRILFHFHVLPLLILHFQLWNTRFYLLNKSDVSIGCYLCYFHNVKINMLFHNVKITSGCDDTSCIACITGNVIIIIAPPLLRQCTKPRGCDGEYHMSLSGFNMIEIYPIKSL